MPGFKFGTNGRICLNSSGQAIQCDCKCGNHCNVGTAANSYTITSTGITLGSCTCIGGVSSYLCSITPPANISSVKIDRMPTASFNGTYSLSTYNETGIGFPSTDTCQWSGTSLDTVDFSAWQGHGCDPFTEVAAWTNYAISWEIVRVNTQWRLLLQVLPGIGSTGPTGFSTCLPPILFYGTLTAPEPEDCSGVLTFTNQITTACQIVTLGGANFVSIASGGTVVCTPH